MKRNKSGISLIVLVITVIVMIILAGSVIISLSNSGIIGKANEAVDANNLKQVQQLAALAWSEAYIDKMTDSTVDLEDRVKEALEKNKVDQSKYVINVTETGVSVKTKTTLGTLVASAEDYGKKVDYTVTVNGTEHKDWRVLYEDEANGYVYLITEKSVGDVSLTESTGDVSLTESTGDVSLTESTGDVSLTEGVTVGSLSAAEKELYSKFQVGSWPKYTLVDTVGSDTMRNCQAVAYLIKNYGNYANKTLYGENNVIGAIGGPTIELLAAGWNAKGYEPEMRVGTGNYGYSINDDYYLYTEKSDGLYLPSNYSYWLASPSGSFRNLVVHAGYARAGNDLEFGPYGVRPVVCLSSNIPAVEGEGVDFSLVKLGE